MKWLFLFLIPAFALAETSERLRLVNYLEQVKSKNPEARAVAESVTAFESRSREADVPLSPEAYAQYGWSDDKKPTPQPIFMGSETRVERWRLGVRSQTNFGLGADLYYNTQHTQIEGASAAFVPVSNYVESTAVLQLTQSLWRNGFGESTRALIETNRAINQVNLLENKYRLKTILLNAQNVYWAVVSYNQIVLLQQENVERAKKLRDYMRQRMRMRLYDDTDAMQAQAAYELRDLELQNSLDERSSLVRQLNTLRGSDSDQAPDLETLPENTLLVAKGPSLNQPVAREDFQMLKARSKVNLEQARYAKAQIRPQLDLFASLATNGRDGLASKSFEQTQSDRYPTWSVGVNLSFSLDYRLVHDVKRGYRSAYQAAESLKAQAEFGELRAWQDMVMQRQEAFGRYERAASVEKIQSALVKRERQRLLNGRATTFEALNMEQNLAVAQIQRVRAQLALLQINNSLKTFEGQQ